MSYYNDLAQSLRKRGCEEEQVLEVLEDVRGTAEASRRAPEDEFGSPDDRASQHSGPRTRSPGSTTLNVFGAIGLVCVVVYAVWPELFGFTNPVLEQFAGVLALLVMLIIGAFAAGFIDAWLPRGFSLKGSTADGRR